MRSGAAIIVFAIAGSACGRLDFAVVTATGDAADATGRADGTGAGQAPVYVQGITGMLGGSTEVDATFAAPSTTGDLIAVAVSWDGAVAITGVTDSNGNSYVLVGSTLSDLGSNSQIAYAANINGAGGPLTVTANFSAASTGLSIIVHEISGADPVNPLVASNAQYQFMPGTATDALSSGALSPAPSNSYVFGASFNISGNDSIYTPGTGFTVAASGSRGSATFMSEYATQIVPVTFTQSLVVGGYMTLGMVFD